MMRFVRGSAYIDHASIAGCRVPAAEEPSASRSMHSPPHDVVVDRQPNYYRQSSWTESNSWKGRFDPNPKPPHPALRPPRACWDLARRVSIESAVRLTSCYRHFHQWRWILRSENCPG